MEEGWFGRQVAQVPNSPSDVDAAPHIHVTIVVGFNEQLPRVFSHNRRSPHHQHAAIVSPLLLDKPFLDSAQVRHVIRYIYMTGGSCLIGRQGVWVAGVSTSGELSEATRLLETHELGSGNSICRCFAVSFAVFKSIFIYSISSLKRMNTPPPPDFLSFRNT